MPLHTLSRNLDPVSGVTLGRFTGRLLLVGIYAAFVVRTSGSGAFATMFALAAFLCSVMALLKHERFLAPSLNHWDEMFVFAALSALAHALVSAPEAR